MECRENDKIKFTLGDDGIFRTECFPHTVMTLEDGKESTRISAEMIGAEPLPLLCDLTNVVRITQECRRHFSSAEHALTYSRCALIVTNPISRIIGNFFLGFNKPVRPIRMFTSREEGLAWLKEEV